MNQPQTISVKELALNYIWHLPHDVRRRIYKSVFNREFKEYEAMRFNTEAVDYALDPFDKHKCIFIHIPKCAGISVSNALFGRLVGTHMAIKTFQLIYSKAEFESYFKFTIVRNPWDRLLSAYSFLKKGGFTEEDQVWAEENISSYDNFKSFVKEWVTPDNVITWQHFKPQHRYLLDPSGKLHIDFVGHFETLAQDFKSIASHIGIDTELQHMNKSRKKRSLLGYQAFYDDETAQIVADVYKTDLEWFGYTFDKGRMI